MKAIFYAVSLLVAAGAAYFSYDLSQKFQALEKVRVDTIAENTEKSARADGEEKRIKDFQGQLAQSKERRDLLTQSISSLKSTNISLASDFEKLGDDLKAQDDEFAQLKKTLEEVNEILKDLGGGVTLESLPDKITQITSDRDGKQKKLEELDTLVTGAEKNLATSRAELDRLNKRMIERSARINRNSMTAVLTAVNQEWCFVVIGAGSNSGFTPQTSLLVERDGRKIGRVKPSSIEPTQTIAEIDFESLSTGVRLQPGDRVILAAPNSN